MSEDSVYKEFVLPFYQAEKILILEQYRSEKAGLIGEIRAFRRLLKYPQSSETGLIQKSSEDPKAMVEQLKSELSRS